MSDYFRVLDLARQPWLDPVLLQARFHELSDLWHPDRHHTAPQAQQFQARERYTLINTAFHCLKDTPSRLAHLLELETHQKPAEVQEIPSDIATLFIEIADLCRGVDQFLERRNALTSPILKARTFGESQDWIQRIQQALGKLEAWRGPVDSILQGWNAVWQAAPAEDSPVRAQSLPLKSLESLFRAVRYEARWSAQLRERRHQLSV